ncbi:FAD-dependent oxidoreductase [Paenibacillus soyae]|uniref:FAD-dependent oxidoreductase n=1 Tax=Paenibacillus soyae TaxID=2969249 RepID=A0A9X2MTC9_9BACL|nr:FAD-dependent oxidoreductase [Paenibacillus soyae]MCR2805426.1 FAD-dependent oxidoreductase [Paenibacillus soyae]
MKRHVSHYEVVVCGGGLAGFSAAVAAARQGLNTCLIQDRPVFGGNSSSEIRVTPHGAACFHPYARETGIISELLIEERYRNHEVVLENGWTNSVWDMTMYDLAMQTPNLTFHMNTTVTSVKTDGKKTVQSILATVSHAELELDISADTFIDCTGDGVIADLAGCEWRMGSEGRSEFGEPHAPVEASMDTMGNSIHFKAKDMGHPVPFKAPEWAVKYEDASFFYEQGRKPYDIRGGYWWIEIGVPWHTIHDAEDIRHELTRHALGVWDWVKNKDPETRELARNYALDWLGQVPGKRESRRIMGQYLMTEHDPMNRKVFRDEIAFGGWFLDLHTPGGLLAPTSELQAAQGNDSEYSAKSYCGPYGIPLRICISKDMNNLMMAGRNVSVTHAALGTVRVMATTALMGQAVGTAAAVARDKGLSLSEVAEHACEEVQQRLLRAGCFLPNVSNRDPLDVALTATVTASSEASLHGVGPDSTWSGTSSLKSWELTKPRKNAGCLDHLELIHPHRLHVRKAQWIAIGSDRLDRIDVCVSNLSDTDQMMQVRLVKTEHIWDYRVDTGIELLQAQLLVVPGLKQWVSWETGLEGLHPSGYVRLDILPNPQLAWHPAGTIEPGHVAGRDLGHGQLRGEHSNYSFRVTPAQSCYGPMNVITGVTRPYATTNVWRSDPLQPLSQWLQLEWTECKRIRAIELTFPGHLFEEYHCYPPFYADPQCAKDYSLQAYVDGTWQTIHRETGNYQRLRQHVLPEPAKTTKLRVVIEATNGDPSAAIYEVRCYE